TRQETSRIVFVIGGSAGLSEEVKKECQVRMSMSRMTFPHQMARMVLAEQLYRAESIVSGMRYHK
ncbi:MAG: 23S rRNA (pseudouridine(1915)-N(3))-methyltransferase RlmH, partial [Oscillospiraceae bacterium]|nr:23S rRNA (pseudouridine(1915)-N(3))-methyltransferase RlmH [Oscillospiraceae bacterium]